MGPSHYKVWDWGFGAPARRADVHQLGVCTLAKRDDANPWAVPNELVALRLGQAIGLPIPAGIVVRRHSQAYFASLNCVATGEMLPPADAAALVRDLPRLACGIVVFDAWILNLERRPENLTYDARTREVQIFDHSRALLHTHGAHHLIAHVGQLGLHPGEHCLASSIESLAWFDDWHERIRQVPEFYIRDALDEAAELGVSADDCQFCCEFLLDRRNHLKEVFREYLQQFPALMASLASPFEEALPDYMI